MELGASFSHPHLKFLKLDPLEAIKEFKQLGLTWIRLGCYWNEIEKEPDKYTFDELDVLVRFCEREKIKIVMTVGMKAPRYPEYYIPNWLSSELHLKRLAKIDTSSPHLLNATLKYLGECIRHFKKSSAIKVWQVENEPLDQSGEKWWRISPLFLLAEISLVRKFDPKRKIMVNVYEKIRTFFKTESC